MNFGKLLKKILPVAQTAGQIVVNSNTGGLQVGTLLRQLLLVAGGSLAAKGMISGDQVEPIVGSVITLGSIVYGQLKTRKERVEKIIIAEAAPDSKAIVK